MNILMIDNGQPFDLETPYREPLGGSETSFILLARGLSELDLKNKVFVSSISNPIHVKYVENLEQIPLHQWDDYLSNNLDVVIVNRSPFSIPVEILNLNIPIFVYMHDAYDQEISKWLYSKDFVNRISLIFTVSDWQKETFNKYFNIPYEKMFTIGNSVDSLLYTTHSVKKDNNKFIFASIPYKGITELMDIWTLLLQKSGNPDFHLEIFSSMNLYGDEKGDEQYTEFYRKLKSLSNVRVHNVVSMKDLTYELLTSRIYIHPQTYHETFGMVLVQSILSNTIPVSTSTGAIPELLPNNYLTKCKDIRSFSCKQEMVDIILNILHNEEFVNEKIIKDFINRFDYHNVARKVYNFL